MQRPYVRSTTAVLRESREASVAGDQERTVRGEARPGMGRCQQALQAVTGPAAFTAREMRGFRRLQSYLTSVLKRSFELPYCGQGNQLWETVAASIIQVRDNGGSGHRGSGGVRCGQFLETF